MANRYITRNGKKLYLVSSSMTKAAAKRSAPFIKKLAHASTVKVVALSDKQKRREQANYGVYIGH